MGTQIKMEVSGHCRNGACHSESRGVFRIFTLVELLVTISVIAVLISLLLPSLKLVMQQARKIECVNNMKHVGIAALAYSGDWNGVLIDTVAGDPWPTSIRNYVQRPTSFYDCPAADRSHATWGYLLIGINQNLIAQNVLSLKRPDVTAGFGDIGNASSNTQKYMKTDSMGMRHLNNANVFFMDGHMGLCIRATQTGSPWPSAIINNDLPISIKFQTLNASASNYFAW